MSNKYSATEQQTIDRDNRLMAAAGLAMSGELEALWSLIEAGTLGITADAKDVDSLALGGGFFTVDPDLTTGLTFAVKAGRVLFGKSVISAAPSTVTLSASTVNYVEVDSAGTVSTNTAGFTAGRARLYTVTTGVSTIASYASAKTLLTATALGGTTGDLLSTAGATKEVQRHAGTVSATTSFRLIVPDVAGTLAKVSLVVATTVAANDTDYWTFSLVNKGQAGAGTAVMLAATAANTTKATGGSALTADTRRDLTLTGTGADLVVAAGDVLVLTCTKTASGANLVDLVARLGFVFTA